MRRASGLTLVEAALGAALLGTLLTAVVLANARLTAQAHAAQTRLEACRIAEGLLRDWSIQEGGIPQNASGEVASHAGWRWRTESSENESATELGLQAVWLRLFGPGRDEKSPSVQVELLVAKGRDGTAK